MKTNRRNFIRGAGAGVGLAATGGVAYKHPQLNPIGRASAIAPVVIGGLIAGGAALGYLTGEVADHYFGADGGELTGTEETTDLHAELRTRLMELYAANDSVLTTVHNRLEDSRNVVWPSAKKEAVKALNNGETESAAKTAAKEAVAAYYAQIQKNMLNRGVEWINSLKNIFDLHQSDSTLASSPVIHSTIENAPHPNVTPGDWSVQSRTATLVDGANYTYKGLKSHDLNQNGTDYALYAWITPTDLWSTSGPSNGATVPGSTHEVDPVSTGVSETWADLSTWKNLWLGIQDAHSQMVSNVNTYCTTLYQNYTAGEIDPSKFLDPVTVASELSSDYESTGYHAYAAAEAAMLGVPGQIENALTIELMDSGITVNGSIWTDWNPGDSSGGSTTTTTTATNTTATTTTTTSDSPTGFVTGTVYDPADTAKDVYLSYEYSGEKFIEGSDVFVQEGGTYVQDGNVTNSTSFSNVEGETLQVGFTKISQPFKIVEAINTETGASVSTVTLESKNHQTAEVSLTEEQLSLIEQLRTELRENEATGGGGGGGGSLFGGDGQPLILVVAGLAVAALLGGRR